MPRLAGSLGTHYRHNFVDITEALRWLAWHTTSPGCADCIRRWVTDGCTSTPGRDADARFGRDHRVDGVPQVQCPRTAGPHPSAQRSAAVLEAARQAVADLFNADPRGVVLGADRAILLSSLADASSSRAGLGYEVVVSRLDDEANIAPWLRAANRYGAKVKWAEVDIETGELPTWQWESLIGEVDPAGRGHLGVGDAGHRHRSAGDDQAGARRRRAGGGRPFRRRALPAASTSRRPTPTWSR